MDVTAGPSGNGLSRDQAIEFASSLKLRYHEPVPLSNLQFDADARLVTPVGPRGVSAKAVNDLSRALKLPPRYMLDSPNDVSTWNFNKKLPGASGKITLVEDENGGAVVAALRPVYNHLAALDLLQNMPKGFEVTNWWYDDFGFECRYTSDNPITIEPREGDVVRAAVHVSLFDLSDRSPGVKGTLLRLVCTNGATVRENSKARSVFQRESWLEPRARIETISGAAVLAMSDLDQLMIGLQKLPNMPVDLPMGWPARADTMKGPLKLVKLNRSDVETTVVALDDEEPTLFGIYNAITRVGRDTHVRKFRNKFESSGAELILKRDKVHEVFIKQEGSSE